MRIYEVVVNRDDTVSVVSMEVEKETRQFYMLPSRDNVTWGDPLYTAFGGSWVKRVPKHSSRIATSARAALEQYMVRRQQDKANSQSAIGQATKQIASANELLMKLPVVDEPVTENAVAGTLTEHGG